MAKAETAAPKKVPEISMNYRKCLYGNPLKIHKIYLADNTLITKKV